MSRRHSKGDCSAQARVLKSSYIAGWPFTMICVAPPTQKLFLLVWRTPFPEMLFGQTTGYNHDLANLFAVLSKCMQHAYIIFFCQQIPLFYHKSHFFSRHLTFLGASPSIWDIFTSTYASHLFNCEAYWSSFSEILEGAVLWSFIWNEPRSHKTSPRGPARPDPHMCQPAARPRAPAGEFKKVARKFATWNFQWWKFQSHQFEAGKQKTWTDYPRFSQNKSLHQI